MVNPNHITPYGEISDEERGLADDLVFNRREDALERFIEHFEPRARRPRPPAPPTRPRAWSPRRRCTSTSCAARRTASRTGSTARVEKIGAVPTLNDVLLPAMKEVGDKFGAGELILPFVLQSAEVMKKAVAHLENYLDRIEGYTKGTVVLATVFGDVHDIGKSLVNTILTNNGYTVVDLGKQVPVGTIIEAAKEHDATAIGLSALLVSTSKQMPLAVQELHAQGLDFPVLIGGAAINRAFGLRAIYPHGKDDDTLYEPGLFYCKDAFEGLAVMDQLVEGDAHAALVAKVARRRAGAARQGPRARGAADRRRQRPLGRAHRQPGADAAVLGRARDPRRPRRALPPPRHARAVQAPLGRPRREGRGLEGADQRDFQPRLERMWREQDYLRPRALLGYFPCYSEGNDVVVLDPEDHERELARFICPRQPQARPHLPGRLLPPEGLRRTRRRRAHRGHGRLRGHRADGAAGGRRRVRRAALRPRPRRADGRGPGRVAALARCARTSASRRTRAAATRGATRRCPTSPSTRRSRSCSTCSRSA